MIGPDPLGVDDLITRIQATDPAAMSRAAGGLVAAADDLDRACRAVRGQIGALGQAWSSEAYLAWCDAATLVAARLAQGGWALRRMAALLRRLAVACGEAQDELRAAYGVLNTMAYAESDPTDVRAHARAIAEAACRRYHAIERAVRAELWDVGDGAPGPARNRPPRILPPPDPAWWQHLLGLGTPSYAWLNRNRSPWSPHGTYGMGEDGRLVPAYRGAPVPAEPVEDGVERGLVELIPALVKRLRIRPRLTIPEARSMFAGAIRSSYGWRAEHITRHIREWYNLPNGAPVPEWMRQDYLDTVTEACVRADRVFSWDLQGGNKTYAVIWRDYRTKRDLMVEFYAEGNKQNEFEFATSFKPTAAQWDAAIRAPRAVLGGD